MAQMDTHAYPQDDQVFELTLRGSVSKNQPLRMVECTLGGPTGWRHQGPLVSGRKTRRFKLVRVGPCQNFQEVQERLKDYSQTAGQWAKAFIAVFPSPDRKGPIGIADSSWVSPYSHAHFPYVRTKGGLNFYKADRKLSVRWRWLVMVKRGSKSRGRS